MNSNTRDVNSGIERTTGKLLHGSLALALTSALVLGCKTTSSAPDVGQTSLKSTAVDSERTPNVPLVASSELRTYYPVGEARQTGWLARPGGDELYYEVGGNPRGRSVIFVHGGPGAYSDPEDRGWFDPAVYNIVIFDQRGAGKSRPAAGAPTTPPSHFAGMTIKTHIEDMEALRKHLGIDQWVVFGGSWGSTLSLAYAEEHPERLLGLILRGIYTGTHEEHEAIYGGDMPDVFPEAHAVLSAKAKAGGVLGEGGKPDIIASYRRLVMDNDTAAMGIWSLYEEYVTNPDRRGEALELMQRLASGGDPSEAASILDAERRATAIFQVVLFPDLEKNQRLVDSRKMSTIKVPVYVVQGAEDPICPPRFADAMVAALRQAKVQVDYKKVPTGGHSAHSEQMAHWLLLATDALRK
jgi:proline iminopeptidase